MQMVKCISWYISYVNIHADVNVKCLVLSGGKCCSFGVFFSGNSNIFVPAYSNVFFFFPASLLSLSLFFHHVFILLFLVFLYQCTPVFFFVAAFSNIFGHHCQQLYYMYCMSSVLVPVFSIAFVPTYLQFFCTIVLRCFGELQSFYSGVLHCFFLFQRTRVFRPAVRAQG